jgi:3'-phosphoadenosine 5'-phosphosulfate sulfotransferase (PAPS reductase)/FAD synthetase
MISVSLSGGVDSIALADMTRRLYPNVPRVYSNTGNEIPEIVKFVRTLPDVTIVRPKHGICWVFRRHGFPVVSKAVSTAISRYRTAKDDVQRRLRLYGGLNPNTGKMQKMGVIPRKWHYLIDAPFKISDECCHVLKKEPLSRYAKETGRAPMTGEMAEDSNKRKMDYLARGCNYFGKTQEKSTPMGFWTRQDVLAYILVFNVKYCKEVYGDIIYNPKTGLLETTGEQRTGCFCCMFGVHLEEHPNRFERMKVKYPRYYEVIMNRWGLDAVLTYMGVAH